jgi:hypothetical protein
MVLPSGNTASRCASGSTLKGGSIRYNNETYVVEYYDSNPSDTNWKSLSHATGQSLNCLTDVVTATASAGNVLVGQGSCYTAKAVSGDVTLASSGCMTIGTNCVTRTKINTDLICGQTCVSIDSNTDYLLVIDATDNSFKKVLACDFSVCCATTAGSSGGGTSDSATCLTNARNFSITGDVTAPAISFNGTANVALSVSLTAGCIVNADINSSAAIDVSKTALVAGTGLTLSTNTINVDAAQTGITSVGTLTSLTMGGTITLNGATTDPAGAEGMIYYNTTNCKFRGYANSTWTDLN